MVCTLWELKVTPYVNSPLHRHDVHTLQTCESSPRAGAEVVLFTAGLEDYAKPILDELDRRYNGVFEYRLYRPATVPCSAYPCLKVGLYRVRGFSVLRC